jgi:hypothetical protein
MSASAKRQEDRVERALEPGLMPIPPGARELLLAALLLLEDLGEAAMHSIEAPPDAGLANRPQFLGK